MKGCKTLHSPFCFVWLCAWSFQCFILRILKGFIWHSLVPPAAIIFCCRFGCLRNCFVHHNICKPSNDFISCNIPCVNEATSTNVMLYMCPHSLGCILPLAVSTLHKGFIVCAADHECIWLLLKSTLDGFQISSLFRIMYIQFYSSMIWKLAY